jgi:hypothetical protein
MWIRSQDKKKLTDYSSVYLAGDNEKIILGMTSIQTKGTLGEYIDKERALEVLDEIHKELNNTLSADSNSFLGVYQMPLE